MSRDLGKEIAPQTLSEETMRALKWIADTPGKEFDGDIQKVVEWLLFSAKKHEAWLRFALDLLTEHERRRAAT